MKNSDFNELSPVQFRLHSTLNPATRNGYHCKLILVECISFIGTARINEVEISLLLFPRQVYTDLLLLHSAELCPPWVENIQPPFLKPFEKSKLDQYLPISGNNSTLCSQTHTDGLFQAIELLTLVGY